jgi:hypothetical protein
MHLGACRMGAKQKKEVPLQAPCSSPESGVLKTGNQNELESVALQVLFQRTQLADIKVYSEDEQFRDFK